MVELVVVAAVHPTVVVRVVIVVLHRGEGEAGSAVSRIWRRAKVLARKLKRVIKFSKLMCISLR